MSVARGGAGFTLVEVLLSLGLTSLVMALTLPLATAQKRIWERQEEGREIRRAVAGALSWLSRDLQQAGYHAPGAALRRLEPTTIAYVLSRDEADPAGFSPANRRLITLWLDGEELKYRIQAPLEPPAAGWERGSTQVLASGLGGMRCSGWDESGAAAADAALARLVECELTARDGKRERVLVRLRTPGGGEAP